MQEDIRFTLFIIGIAVIGGVLLHGIWTIRKNSKRSKRASFESKNWEPGFEHEDDLDADVPLYDDVGVGKAKVVFNSDTQKKPDTHSEQDLLASSSSALSNDQSKNISDDIEDDSFSHTNQIKFESSYTSNNDTDPKDMSGESSSTEATQASSNEVKHSATLEDETEASVNEQNSEDSSTACTEQSQSQPTKSEPPPRVYSNVVTQPKPEFHRPLVSKDALGDDYGHPPGFLLRKQQNETNLTSIKIDNDLKAEHKAQQKQQHDIDATDTASSTHTELERQPSEQTEETGHEPEKPTKIYETSAIPDEAKAPDFSLNIQEGPDKTSQETNKPGVEKELSFAEQAKRFVRRNKKSASDKIRKEPVMKNAEEDQLHIDFDVNKPRPIVREEQLDLIGHDNAHETADKPTQTGKPANEKVANAAASKPEKYSGDPVVLVLNVRANTDKPIEGAALLPMLLTLGFKFGEHEIFHRHVNTNGKGPILFSLANMLKPGNFDIDNIENFSTLGVSLFMMLPIEGDAQQVFNMMHNAARKLADEFDCRILDGNKVAISKQSIQQYIERIREFERKRMSR